MADNKIVKLKRRRAPKIGIFIFLIIFIYIIINIVLYYNKEHMATCEVQAEDIAGDYVFTGVAVRDEALVRTERAGYINCYAADKSRVSKGMPVFSVDENNMFGSMVSAASDNAALSETDIMEIKNSIYKFRDSFSLTDYESVRDYKQELSSVFSGLTELRLFAEMQGRLDNQGQLSSPDIMQSNVAGVISYQSDSLLGLTADEVTADIFNNESYTVDRLRTGELSGAGTPVYRIVTSESWKIVVNIDEDFYLRNLETATADITVLDDNYSMTLPAEFIKRGNAYLAVLSLDDYMVRYIDKRYLSIEFESSGDDGLKIPLTSITHEDFYVIPNSYLKTVEGYSSRVIAKKTFDATSGEASYTYIEPSIYYDDGELSYIDMSAVDAGSYIYDEDTQEDYRITRIERLEGVYNVNKGYTVFRRIERIRENDEYCIIKKNTPYGVSEYDHIVLDASTADNAVIIY